MVLTRLRLAIHVLCGKPLMYRIHCTPVKFGGDMQEAWIVDNYFDNKIGEHFFKFDPGEAYTITVKADELERLKKAGLLSDTVDPE